MYSLPSASHMREPDPRTMIGGSPPTLLNARAGESTPPGITRSARCCNARDLLRSKDKRKIYHRVMKQEIRGVILSEGGTRLLYPRRGNPTEGSWVGCRRKIR